MSEPRSERGWQQYLILGALVLFGIAASVVLLWSVGAVTEDRSTGAEPSSVYHEALSAGFPLQGKITWREPAPNLARVPTDATIDRIEHDWAAIWFTIDGLRSGEPVANPELLLDTSLIDRLREHQPADSRLTVRQVSHELQVNYYSIDGAVVRVSVTEAIARHDFTDSVTDHPLSLTQASEYSAVLVLTDGRWRLVGLDRHGRLGGVEAGGDATDIGETGTAEGSAEAAPPLSNLGE